MSDMLDDVAAYLILSPLAGILALAAAVVIWMARGRRLPPGVAPSAPTPGEPEVNGRPHP